MNNKQQKWTAWLAVLTFVWLMQISAMPMTGAGFAEQTGVAGSGQGPDYYEAIAQKAPPAKKKSILPYVLIGVGVLAVTAVVLFLLLKSSYDITGTWRFTFTLGSESEIGIFTFIGNKDSGTYVSDINASFAGTYTVDDKNVTMLLTAFPSVQFTGEFTGKDAMSGTYGLESQLIYWTATRISASASTPRTPTGQTKLLLK